jgi:hypothetical protein
MKPIRDPELYTGLCEVEDLLEKDGWIKDQSRSSDGHCLMDAVSRVTDFPYTQARNAIYSSIIAEAPQYKRIGRCAGVVRFNDDPETTWEDVRRVLRRARESAFTPPSGS